MAADFLRFDLKQCRRGDVVEVTLNRGANVRVLDTNNFSKYRRGEKHTYWWRPRNGVNRDGRRPLIDDVTRRL